MQTFFRLVGDEVTGWCSRNLVLSLKLPSSTWVGGGLSSYRRTQRSCYVYSLRRNQNPAPRLHYCFLTASPLFLHPLPSLMSRCLNQLFGIQGRSSWLNEPYFLQIETEDTEKICIREGPSGSCCISLPHVFERIVCL